MDTDEAKPCSAVESCVAAKQKGNAAFGAGELESAAEWYEKALAQWEHLVQEVPQPKGLEVGQLVRYDKRNYFGVVMSCFPLFDEYFLKDLGSDKAIWVGEAGGNLRRFDRKDLHAVRKEDLELRQALAQNLAATYLRKEAWDKCVRWADAALVIEGKAPKALFRKGAALLQLNQPGPASDCLATCAEVTPKDVEVRRLLREAEARRSPTWVCATGCCGPWGIVCGGPVWTSGANAITVAPGEKRGDQGDTESVSTAAATTSDIGPNFKLGPRSGCLSDRSSESSSDDEPDPKPAPRRAPAVAAAPAPASVATASVSARLPTACGAEDQAAPAPQPASAENSATTIASAVETSAATLGSLRPADRESSATASVARYSVLFALAPLGLLLAATVAWYHRAGAFSEA